MGDAVRLNNSIIVYRCELAKKATLPLCNRKHKNFLHGESYDADGFDHNDDIKTRSTLPNLSA
jgi:hypothetical protein